MSKEWYGFDLDGTLATYERPYQHFKIGEPIEPMIRIVKDYINRGRTCKILTARVNEPDQVIATKITMIIQDWTQTHIGLRLPVTYAKDYNMIELWDDRAVAVETNTGRVAYYDGGALISGHIGSRP